MRRFALVMLFVLAALPAGARAETKSCVGNPPRQTEDPLSPPCIPSFDGDNGGATYDGVTADEIRVVLYNDLGVSGDMNAPWRESDESPGSEADFESRNLVRTVKAQLRFFQNRYQTYGRTVRVVAAESQSGLCPGRQADADDARKAVDPFAAVLLGDNASCFMQQFATFKLPSFAFGNDIPRKDLGYGRPYMWSFNPDQETEAAYSASFLCRKLYGGTAKFTDDLLLKGKPRKFGLIHPREDAARGPADYELSRLLVKYVSNECGMKFAFEETISGGGEGQATGIIQKFKRAGVTTVVCYCVPVSSELSVTKFQAAATSLLYFPEWYWDHASRMDKPMWEQMYGSKLHQSFGVSYWWRTPAFRDQYPYKAYVEQEPDSTPNERFNWDIYHALLNLFWAIQAAGPTLTPDAIEHALFTFTSLSRENPFEPIGGYGPYNAQAVSYYSFIDTGMGWWWDPTGTEPGGTLGEGCIRVMHEGTRYYAGEWPRGDADLFVDSAPCTAAPQHASPV